MQIMKERWGDNAYLLDNLQQNPLPNSYMVYVNDKASADRVSKEAPEIAGVSDIKYYQDTVEKLSKITRAVEVGSIVMMALLIVVSVIVVANKLDKLKKSQVEPALELIRETLELTEADILLPFSAEKGMGKEDLIRLLVQTCGG